MEEDYKSMPIFSLNNPPKMSVGKLYTPGEALSALHLIFPYMVEVGTLLNWGHDETAEYLARKNELITFLTDNYPMAFIDESELNHRNLRYNPDGVWSVGYKFIFAKQLSLITLLKLRFG